LKRNKKANKLERTQQKKQILEYYQKGTGLYLFKNRSAVASLELPKVSKDGKKWIQPNETWQGDSYFLSMVPKEAILVQTLIEEKKIITEEKIMEEKLILDQPDQITNSGKVEHKVNQEDLPLNETTPKDKPTEEKEKLLTEDPLAGVTIIRD
jgi:hypothetical protein